MKTRFRLLLLSAVLGVFASAASCSISSIAARVLTSGDSGSGGGALGVFMRENDPEFVAEALPTLIKTLEALLASEPQNRDLRLTVGSAYIMYANAFVEGPAVRLPQEEYERRLEAKRRALNFYKRGTDYVGGALEAAFPGVTTDAARAAAAAPRMKKAWVPFLYWYAAGTTAAFALDPLDIPLSMRVPAAKALMQRAFELEPGFMGSAIADFFISFYAGVPDVLGGDKTKVEEFYRLALELNGGQSPGTYVAYAMAVCLPAQDAQGFSDLMRKALAIDPDTLPDSRLMIILSQRNAAYYLANRGDFFLE